MSDTRPSSQELSALEDAFARGDTKAAAALADELSTKYPKATPGPVAKARLKAAAGDAKGAIKDLEKLADQDKTSGLARAYLGSLLSATGEHKKAIAQLEAALKKPDGDVPAAHHSLGVSLLQTGKYKEAMTHLGKAADAMPTSAPTFFWFGQGCEIAKDYANAARAYVECVKNDPRYPGAFAALVRCHALQGNLDLAASTVEEGLKHNPGDPDLMRFRVQVAFDRNDHAAAQRALLAIPEAERDIDDLHNLVMLALQAEDAAGAEPHARLAVKKAPDDWRAHWLLGLALEGKQPPPRREVIEAYENAIARGDPQGEAGTRLGLVLLQGDDANPDLAAEVLEEARARNPEHAGLLLHLALARANQGERDQAKELASAVTASANATASEREQAERLLEALASA